MSAVTSGTVSYQAISIAGTPVTSVTLPCCDSSMEPSYPSPRRNLELKARDHDPARSLQACHELGAEDKGTLTQRDTYFEVPRGRLKLREEPDAVATLIAYERPDLAGNKESRYRLVGVSDPAELRAALESVLGITVVVGKTRRLFIHEGVRIHLDRVEGLGDFVEFEAAAAQGEDPARFTTLLDDLRKRFSIRDEDLLRESYSDLLLGGRRADLLDDSMLPVSSEVVRHSRDGS
jgi:adenylate cyclase class 2